MKLKLPNKKAFTIIEILVSIVVMSIFIIGVMYLYSRSSDSFKITAWKQERTAQADIFWANARKALEEATNDLRFEAGAAMNPTLKEELKPIKIHPDPGGAPDGNILAWNVSKTTFDMATAKHSSIHSVYALTKQGRRLNLVGGDRRPGVLDDVVDIKFTVSSVMKTANNDEEIKEKIIDSAAIGTLLEIAITLAPPPNFIAGDLRVPMNHKFRLNVAPFSDSAPTY